MEAPLVLSVQTTINMLRVLPFRNGRALQSRLSAFSTLGTPYEKLSVGIPKERTNPLEKRVGGTPESGELHSGRCICMATRQMRP